MKLTSRLSGLWVAFLLVGASAQAYIPSSKIILSRMVRQNTLTKGVGGFVLDQEVSFQAGANSIDALTLHEHWVVENAETMKVTVTSAASPQVGGVATVPAFRLDVLYRDGKRYFYDPLGQVKTVAASGEFMEPYLYFRTSGTLLANLLRAKILPADFTHQMRAPIGDLKTYKYTPEPYAQLERIAGTPAYALGEKPTAANNKSLPGIWVEQDAFVLRRLRWPSQAEMEITKTGNFPLVGNHVPLERTIGWGGNKATIHVVSVKPLKDATTYLSTTGFNAAAGEKVASQVPETAIVKEFYSRFR